MYVFLAGLALSAALLAADSRPPEQILQDAIRSQQSGDLLAAIRDYRAFLNLKPDVARARSNLGVALAAIGHYEEAIAEYLRALELDPENRAVSLNLALAYYKSGKFPFATVELTRLHDVEPANKQVLLLLADCYLRGGENQQVVALLSPIEKDNENDLAVNYLLGTALILNNDAARGRVVIERILRKGDSAEARLLMGTMKYKRNDIAGAVLDLKRALEFNPRLPELNSHYGLALLASGDNPGASAAFERELASNPNDFEANFQLGVLANQDQRFDQALAYLQHALRVRPGAYGPRHQIATIHLAAGKLEEARVELEALTTGAPSVVEAHITLAVVYYRLKRKGDGDRERAIVQELNAVKQALEPTPRSASQPARKPD